MRSALIVSAFLLSATVAHGQSILPNPSSQAFDVGHRHLRSNTHSYAGASASNSSQVTNKAVTNSNSIYTEVTATTESQSRSRSFGNASGAALGAGSAYGLTQGTQGTLTPNSVTSTVTTNSLANTSATAVSGGAIRR